MSQASSSNYQNHGDDPQSIRARAHARASWTVRKFRLGAEPSDDLSASTTAEQRLAMMWELTLEAWALAGLPIPAYPRASAPVRLVDLGIDERGLARRGANS
ncbi:MAG: hypothetical protein L0Z55_10635 [Planctomycetes bacterium]|nr:hypothetical protein [Planctomycetota bacterium]